MRTPTKLIYSRREKDIAIMEYLLNGKPCTVSVPITKLPVEAQIGDIILQYEDNTLKIDKDATITRRNELSSRFKNLIKRNEKK